MASNETPLRNTTLIKTLSSDFTKLYASSTAWGNMLSMARLFPQLRALWAFSSVDESGSVYDLSNQGRTIAPGNAPDYGVNGLVPYADFVRANSDYLTRADEAGLSITQYMTLGVWVKFDAPSTGNQVSIVSKWLQAGDQRSYILYKNGLNHFSWQISGDGTGGGKVKYVIDTNDDYSTGTWFFIAGTFTASTVMKIFVNGSWFENDFLIAEIYDGTAALNIGRNPDGTSLNYLDGKLALVFICADDLDEAIIEAFYAHTKALFGVR